MDEKITSRENAKIKYACRLSSSAAFRRSEGRFLAEGRKLCPELCRGAALETLFSMYVGLELFGVSGFFLGPVGLLIIEDLVKLYGEDGESR